MHEELQFSGKSSGAVFHAVLFIMFDCKVLEKKTVLGKDQINFLQFLCLFVWFCKTKLHF